MPRVTESCRSADPSSSSKRSHGKIVLWSDSRNVAPIALAARRHRHRRRVINDVDPTNSDDGDTERRLGPDDTTAAPAAGFDGDWVPTDASEFGYRVDEVIAGVDITAVGRSNQIDGLLDDGTKATTVDIEVLVENITSDDARRDGQFSGRIMSADESPRRRSD